MSKCLDLTLKYCAVLVVDSMGALVHTLFRTLFRNGRFKFMFCRDIVVSLRHFQEIQQLQYIAGYVRRLRF